MKELRIKKKFVQFLNPTNSRGIDERKLSTKFHKSYDHLLVGTVVLYIATQNIQIIEIKKKESLEKK